MNYAFKMTLLASPRTLVAVTSAAERASPWHEWETLGAYCLPTLTPKTVKRKAENTEAKEG